MTEKHVHTKRAETKRRVVEAVAGQAGRTANITGLEAALIAMAVLRAL